MADEVVDRDRLATHLRARMEDRKLSLRAAAAEIGCSAATLARMLEGSKSPNVPDTANLIRAASWVGRGLSEFEHASARSGSTIADVEVHLRAIKDLAPEDKDALIGLVKAAYEARRLRTKKEPRR